MKLKQFKIFYILNVFLFVFMLFQTKTLGFDSGTHEDVTRTGLNKIHKISEILNKHNELSEENNAVIKDLKNYEDYIVKYSLEPDNDDNQGSTFKSHFYNPITKRNFLSEKKTALKKFKKHYSNAIADYYEGNKESAYEQLGRSIHFMEDMNTPVHTGYDNPADAIMKLQLHVHFERICDEVSCECDAIIPIESLNYYEVNSLEDIAKAGSNIANDNFNRLEYVYSKGNLIEEQKIAKNSVLNAQKKVVGIFYKFAKEAKSREV